MKFMSIAIISGLAVQLAGTARSVKSKEAPKALPGSLAEIYKTIDGIKQPLPIFEPKDHTESDKRILRRRLEQWLPRTV